MTLQLKSNLGYIKKYISILRNHIAHNNEGTTNPDAKEDLLFLISKEADIEMYEGQVRINSSDFICKILNLEYDILMFIAERI